MRKILSIIFLSALLASCNQQVDQNEEIETATPEEINYSELGNLIVTQSQQALGGELKAAIQRGGILEAVNYCNLNAIPLTDSLASFYNVAIKRATSKPRNPQNEASAAELEILSVWETKQQNAGVISPVLFDSEGTVDFYSPIIVQSLCTNCHGKIGESLTVENNQIIKEKYPNDQSVGYAEGDLRGMWHITFKK
mgnify:CR=1 FL=1|jgi:hypothetical protein